MPDSERVFYTVSDVAAELAVSEQTVRRWIRSGELPATKLSRRAGFRVEKKDLDALLDRRKAETQVEITVRAARSKL